MSQWLEWKAWVALRGPIGPDRWDFYTSYIAMNAGGPYENPKEVTIEAFQMPWIAAQAEEIARAKKK